MEPGRLQPLAFLTQLVEYFCPQLQWLEVTIGQFRAVVGSRSRLWRGLPPMRPLLPLFSSPSLFARRRRFARPRRVRTWNEGQQTAIEKGEGTSILCVIAAVVCFSGFA